MTEYQLLLRRSIRRKNYSKKLMQRHGNEIINDFNKLKADYKVKLNDIAIKYGFTRERARQIFNKLNPDPYGFYQRILRNQRVRGKRFGRLTAITEDGKNKWLCLCDCGNMKIVYDRNLLYSNRQSCGCAIKTHGMSNTKAHRRWANMLSRCRRETHPLYKYYGGRGITVCKRWFKFENFYKDMGDCPEGLTIERIDNEKGYFPDNCKWGTYTEQANNRRPSTRIYPTIEFKGQKLTKTQWARKIGLNYMTLDYRLKRWSLERALTEPLRSY